MQQFLRLLLPALIALWLPPIWARPKTDLDCERRLAGAVSSLAPALAKDNFAPVTITSLNAKTFKYEHGAFSKSDLHMRMMAEILLRQRPGIVSLQEVLSYETLEHFNRRYLNSEFDIYFEPSRFDRGHSIGFLVRKSLHYRARIEHHRDMMWRDPATQAMRHLFTHDAPTLLIFESGSTNPKLVLIGHHGKSKKDRPGDPESTMLRSAQIKGLRILVTKYTLRFGDNAPIALVGDFNTNLLGVNELEPLSDMSDAFDITGLHLLERGTHMYFNHGKGLLVKQLDGAFLNAVAAKRILRAGVDQYRRNGREVRMPRNIDERDFDMPSDHFPIWFTINLNRR